ncbi:acetate--CoA ligase [Patescibacteria group bacterium]|nr:acetate--CoA ligase [Patescibacteria group bacterium]MCL5797717.1 acetate--CoA ligase [Patescibacteria group bacterium]
MDNSAQVYKKNIDLLKVKPNLTEYENTYKNFSWDNVRNELEWFPDGKINIAYNAVDRHLNSPRKDKIALYWEGDNAEKKQYTFADIARLSNQFGNFLKSRGVARGDRVFIFLPRIPYLYISFIGILKIGAIAGTLFSAFQEQALFDRLENSGAKVLITDKELAVRIQNVREKLPNLKEVVIVDDENFDNTIQSQSTDLAMEHMDQNDYAFMLYTSGTTGKPKGVVHRHYALLSEHLTAKYILDIHEEDIYWCTADPGWVTGIAYEILGSWSNGATEVVYSGRFSSEKWYQILADYKVTVWYTAPTAVRMLMASGDELVKKYDLSHLRHILSVGEPLNPEAIRWGLKVYGLAFHDTWWQTETGAMMLVNFPCNDIKLGSMGKPFLGITAEIVDDSGNGLGAKTEGHIAFKPGWPSMMQTIWQRQEKYDSYFVNGWYISGDRGWKDEDGYFWFIGRSDDVIKTSGERVGPFEVESALVEHPAVIEAGVIGKPDELRGEIIKAFVVLRPEFAQKVKDQAYAETLKQELAQHVKKHLAGHAYPREIEFIDKLPKTRSGKIMRRILKAKELGQPIGDTSTLEEY